MGGTKGDSMSENKKKCANPVCSCVPTGKNKYCSAYCEGTAGQTVVICHCGHEECAGNATK